MVRIVYRVIIKEGKVEDFKELAGKILLPEAQKMPECKLMSLFQNVGNEREFIFNEKWDTEDAVHRYKERLIALIGQPNEGEEFPRVMNEMIEEDEDLV